MEEEEYNKTKQCSQFNDKYSENIFPQEIENPKNKEGKIK
jgi:hypothetical protein